MGYAIHQNMEEVWQNPDKWINHGRNILEDNCKHKTQDKGSKENRETNVRYSGYCDECDVSEDSARPMMNYLYPLELTDFDEDKILKVVRETNCTVLENNESGEWFLALCGGGMDLSQDIGYSYMILETWLPDDLLQSVNKQPLLSLGSKKYKELAKQIIKQLKMRSGQYKQRAKEWKERLKSLNEKEKNARISNK